MNGESSTNLHVVNPQTATAIVASSQHDVWQRAGHQAAQRLPAAAAIAALAAFQTESESMAPLMIWQRLHELSFVSAQGWLIADARQQAGVADCYQFLLEKWHCILEDEGIVEQREQHWFASECAPSLHSIEQRIDDGKIRLRRCLEWHAEGEAFLNTLFADPQSLCEVMRYPKLAQNPLSSHKGRLLYAAMQPGSMLTDYLGQIAASLLQTATQGSDCPRVLEMGADTCHDDLHQLRDRQGCPSAQLDAVLATGLLHTTHCLDTILHGIWHALKPEGVLIVVESTEDSALRWITAAMVLQQATEGHSQPVTLSLSRETWLQAFVRQGFLLVGDWPQPGTALSFAGQQVFMVQRPG
ncbi:hypothetical protein VH86_16680 [Pantoea sp. BL1]|uniref:SAM-dependent methyltransferase n=1 Tax=unclassified Pantoea TaxID=2630326 RepID=UPI0005F85B59|nr:MULTISPECIES: SAM-dependent methyltransferase [unclassified Pantoea]KJV25494.1 hypothetical protein VI01_23560 [Pantoea sp. SM3]KJV47251.1 hypothetical protein VH86_16680 [Pantoea sp. BL1]